MEGAEQKDSAEKQVKYKAEHMKRRKDINPEEFGYLAIPDIDLEWPQKIKGTEKLWRKCKENPFVPIGKLNVP